MHRCGRSVQERLRVHADEDQQYRKAEHHDQFARVHALQDGVGLGRAEVGAVDHDQRVDRTEHQAGGSNGTDPRRLHKGTHQDQELADEVTGTRQAQGCGGEEQADRRQVCDARPHATHLTHVTGVQAFVQLATEDKEGSGRNTVGQHLDHCALQRQLAAGVDADQYETHVGNG